MKQPENIEKLLDAYKSSLQKPSADRLRKVLVPKNPHVSWRIWAVPAAVLAVALLLVLPRLRQNRAVAPTLSGVTAVSTAAAADSTVETLSSTTSSEQQVAESTSEDPQFDSTDALVPPATIGDDF